MERGLHLPIQLGVLDEHRKLPQRDPVQRSGQKRGLVHFQLKRTHLAIKMASRRKQQYKMSKIQ